MPDQPPAAFHGSLDRENHDHPTRQRKIRRFMKRLAHTPTHGQTLMLSKRRQFDMRLHHSGPPHHNINAGSFIVVVVSHELTFTPLSIPV
jgi:hypothetical protein